MLPWECLAPLLSKLFPGGTRGAVSKREQSNVVWLNPAGVSVLAAGGTLSLPPLCELQHLARVSGAFAPNHQGVQPCEIFLLRSSLPVRCPSPAQEWRTPHRRLRCRPRPPSL